MKFCNQKIALFLVEHALTKYFILQNNFHFSLTNEQRAVLNCASLGHNLLVSGQAGTGKSTLVNSIVKELTSCGKKVKVVCSSGISCSLYGDSINSQTVHSCYGLQTLFKKKSRDQPNATTRHVLILHVTITRDA